MPKLLKSQPSLPNQKIEKKKIPVSLARLRNKIDKSGIQWKEFSRISLCFRERQRTRLYSCQANGSGAFNRVEDRAFRVAIRSREVHPPVLGRRFGQFAREKGNVERRGAEGDGRTERRTHKHRPL